MLVLSSHIQDLLIQEAKDKRYAKGGPAPWQRHGVILTGGIARTPDSSSIPSGRLFPNHRAKAFLVTDFMGLCKEGKTPLAKTPPKGMWRREWEEETKECSLEGTALRR